MELNLKGKVAIVTGASRGIGRAIAQTLSNEGMKLVLVARTKNDLEETAALCKTESLVLSVDLRETSAAEKVISATIEHFSQIDLLVNDAGATKRGDFFAMTDDDWQDGFALKFFGAMRLTRAAWPHLQKSHGSVVNIIGIGGKTASADFTIGGSVNAALMNLTKALADRGTKDGIRVNAINPGSIETDRLSARIKNLVNEYKVDETEIRKQMTQKVGIVRFGKPEEIANMVAYLASSQANYMQGSIIDVDGGQTRTL